MLSQSCSHGINPTWSLCIVLQDKSEPLNSAFQRQKNQKVNIFITNMVINITSKIHYKDP